MRCVLLALVLVALFAGQAMADNGNVPNATMDKMGLSGMKTMTDVEGAEFAARASPWRMALAMPAAVRLTTIFPRVLRIMWRLA